MSWSVLGSKLVASPNPSERFILSEAKELCSLVDLPSSRLALRTEHCDRSLFRSLAGPGFHHTRNQPASHRCLGRNFPIDVSFALQSCRGSAPRAHFHLNSQLISRYHRTPETRLLDARKHH